MNKKVEILEKEISIEDKVPNLVTVITCNNKNCDVKVGVKITEKENLTFKHMPNSWWDIIYPLIILIITILTYLNSFS